MHCVLLEKCFHGQEGREVFRITRLYKQLHPAGHRLALSDRVELIQMSVTS